MILVDTALEKLEKEGKPIRVGMVGAGFMGRGIALQILKFTKGMRLVAIANRNIENAIKAYSEAGVDEVIQTKSQTELDMVIENKRYVVTDEPLLLARSHHIDVLVEVTGTIDYALLVVLEAFKHKKHVVLMNAELDGTLGPLLKKKADTAGVIYTSADGDQPGVEMNLYRFVKGLGVTPVMCGNIKGLQDPYRTPETQAGFAKKWGQKPHMVTSFADGTKISFEQAIVANATGMKVARRGMLAPVVAPGTSLEEAVKSYDVDQVISEGGIVDYLVGPNPNGGVFVLGTHDDPAQKHFLNLYKVGEGPLYLFYNPYHLCHFEVPTTIARAVLFSDATIAPKDKPYVEVVATAKRDLTKGETLDPIGHFMTYGQSENASLARRENLLPIGLAEGAVLTKDIAKDTVLTFDDVSLPRGRLSDKLWKEQVEFFFGQKT